MPCLAKINLVFVLVSWNFLTNEGSCQRILKGYPGRLQPEFIQQLFVHEAHLYKVKNN